MSLLSVLPLLSDRLMRQSEIAENPGLSDGWTQAEAVWDANKVQTDDSDLLLRVDYMSQLSSQLPIASLRVVYTKAGSALNAALVEDSSAVIDHRLYWAPVSSRAEGRYLVGILNSEVLLKRVTPLQNVGLFGPRDFDKNVFYVAFGPYASSNTDHAALVSLVERAEEVAGQVEPLATADATRVAVRRELAAAGLDGQIEEAVGRILPIVANDKELLYDVPAKPDFDAALVERRDAVGDDLEEADVEIDLDVEHDDDGVYLWGYLVTRRGEASSEYRSAGSRLPGPDPHGLIARSLISEVSDVIRQAHEAGMRVRLFHYGTTERRHLEKFDAEAADLLVVATDLLKFVRSRFSSAIGYSLKTLARISGASWRTEGLDGASSSEWIAKARSGDEQAWAELLRYNEDDVRATLALRRYLRN